MTEQTSTPATAPEPWYIDENILGQGPRPDYLKQKFRTLAEQARNYNELERRVGGMAGAPETYNLEPYKDFVDPENEHIKSFMSYAKQNNFTQESVDTFFGSLTKYSETQLVDEAAELQKLGADGAQRRTVIDQWVENTFTPKARETYSIIPKTAGVVEFFDEMRQQQARLRSNVPTGSDMGTHVKPPETEQQIRKEMQENSKRYQESEAYRSEINQRLRLVHGE